MKVIIVEDETIIRNGLVKHIDWDSLGIGEVRVAANAAQALAVCEDYVPDIVISDISMPGDNGIVLCRKLQQRYPEIEIIFVTGYADKEYLKAAIDMHAVRYVEKPINRADIAEAVREAVCRVRRTIEQKEARLHTLFIDSSASPLYTSGKNVFQAGILHFRRRECMLEMKRMLAEGLDCWLRKNRVSMLVEISDPATLSFLLCGEDAIPLARQDQTEFTGSVRRIFDGETKWFLAMGEQVEAAEKITDSWQGALYTERALAYMGWNRAAFPIDVQGEQQYAADRSVIDRLTEAVSGRKKKAASQILDAFTEEMLQNQVFLNGDIRHIYYELNAVLERAGQAMRLNAQGDGPDEADADFFEKAETFCELNQRLQGRLAVLFQEEETPNSAYAVKMVTDYIWENYGDANLSIKTLADHVCLTPTYLSNLFKKNMGLTIGQHIVDVRIEHAKRMMKDPQYKFYQVASMVGYEDANYFAKIFKKKTGMTPSEYKESLSLR